ncbi:MAG: HNH endonuclease [Pseudonocardia sp.]|nr:HNH endonuclease [Pseudonocardia sp.]
MAKRQLVGRPDTIDTAAVPQHVKSAVYQRDSGRCCECGARSYLEFDHVIPRSKGGATSVNNLQLLCRRCNLRKGDRL